MECNTKWEWENLDGSCFNLPGGGGGGGSGDDGGSVDYYNSKKKDERDGTYKLEASVCSGESFIGLKLGKRTYFENSYSKDSNITPPVLGIPASSVSTEKKVKTCSQSQSTPISRCQVEGCNLDLSAAKEYHRKHRVCEGHSKCPKVIVAGLECRFCQQCSRFHSMSEFDEEKRSCRRKLSDHNARRRKLQQDATRFNSPTQYSSFYGTESIDVLSRAAGGVQFSHILNMPTLAPNGGVGSKGATDMISNQDFKESLASHVDGVDLQRVLSLLSNNSWGSCEPYSTAHDRSTSPTMVQSNSSPISSHEYREANQQSFNPKFHAQTSTTNNRFQESQTFKPPYENSFLFHPNS